MVRPWLGHYEGGYLLALEGAALVLHLQSRRIELRWLRGDSYIMADGLLPGSPPTLRRAPDGTPVIDVAGIDRVRRTVG